MLEFARKFSALNEAGQMLNSAVDSDEVFDRIVTLVSEVFELDTCAILLLENDTEELTIARAKGYDPDVVKDFRGRRGVGLTGYVVEHAKAVFVPDVTSDPRYIGGVTGAVSELAAPMFLRGEVIGVLDAEQKQKGHFSEADLALFSIFANHAATAVYNARLREKLTEHGRLLEDKVRALTTLARSGRSVSEELDLDTVLNRILLEAQEALRFRRCAILLLDPGTTTMRIRAAIGYRPEVVDAVTIIVGQGVTGSVAARGRAMLLPDVREQKEYIAGTEGGLCEMAAPLMVRNEAIGVLDAEIDEVGGFSERDLELFTTFASHVAVAIRNAELYSNLNESNVVLRRTLDETERLNTELAGYSKMIQEANAQLERRVKELETLHNASQAISSSLDLGQTLAAIVTMTKEIIHSSASAIRLFDEDSHPFVDSSPALNDQSQPDQPELQSFADAPLIVAGKTIGSFEIGSSQPDAFGDEERRVLNVLAGHAAVAIENARLFEETQRTCLEAINSLAAALEARDAYTRGHSERVARSSLFCARQLKLDEAECELIRKAALLHDIGKIGISDGILNKTMELTSAERNIICKHPSFGSEILGPIQFLSNVRRLVAHHHERWDGAGYPDGLKEEEIPIESRIVAVADAFDAMTSERAYRGRMTTPEALEELTRGAGAQFDPRVVSAFVSLVEGGQV